MRYNTSGLTSADRFAYWHDAICETYVRLGCDAQNRGDFNGSIEIERHSSIEISRITGATHSVMRRKRDIQSSSDEAFLFSLQTAKHARIGQLGNVALLAPGDMALYLTSATYQLDLTDQFSQLVVRVPVGKLLARLPNARALCGKRIDGQAQIGRLIGQNLLAFTEQFTPNNLTLNATLQDTMIDMVASGLASLTMQKVELSSPEQMTLIRAKSFIRENLDNINLNRTIVAGEIGLSVRRLGEIFSKEDQSISGFIRAQRLSQVAANLQDVRFSSLTISEIALRNGFQNFQHFSTLFRKEFGLSPREYRANKVPSQSS